jgi:MtrB/PioB family decaheme-associated outer membrane protein
MRRARTTLLVVAGFVLLALASGSAWAQTEFFGLKIDGSVELGGRAYIDRPTDKQSGKFEEYRDIPQGLFLEDLRLRLSTKDDRYLFEFKATEAGEDDQNFLLRSSRLGFYEFEFEWDQIPHIYSTTGRFLGTETQRGVFTLPSPRPALSAHDSAPRLDEIGLRWDTARLSLALTPTPEWDLKAEYTRINKDGDRPIGMSFGSPGGPSWEILEPIEQTIHDLRFSTSLARENWQLQFAYTISLFQNALDAVISDNPSFATDGAFAATATGGTSNPSRGRIALAPDNIAHTWTLAGGVNLPLRTRVNASLSYSWRLQDQDFLPHTINPVLVANSGTDLNLPKGSLDGDVRILLFNMNATSRPLNPLTLTARYRVYDYNDQTDEIIFSGRVDADRSFLFEDVRATRFPYTKHNAGMDARWRILTPLAFTVGMGWERWDRSDMHREAPITDEFMPKASLDYTPTDWLLLRATYVPSFREINDYNPHSHLTHLAEEDAGSLAALQHVRLRKFDQANRDRQRGDLLLQLTPLDTLTTSLTYSIRKDDYKNSFFGLQKDDSWAAGIDVTWTPHERVSVYTSYVREEYLSQLRSRYRAGPTALENVTFDWVAKNSDAIDTFGAGLNTTLIPRTLEFGLNWNLSYAIQRMRAFNPLTPTGGTAAQNRSATAVNFPVIEDTLNRLEASLRYHFWKNWTAKLQYVFESFQKTDFRTDQLLPSEGTTNIFLGNDPKNYTAHIIGATLRYKFE